jgi:two-component system sensor histidine kinase AgrC
MNNNRKFMAQLENYIYILNEKEKLMKNFRHDIKSHIISLKYLMKKGRYDEVIRYLDDLDNAITDFTIDIQTGHHIVNAVINGILSDYHNIKLNWNGIVPSNIKISAIDLSVIFHNIIINACEAVSAIEDSEKRYVNVNIYYKDKILKILVTNPYENIKFSSDNTLETIKPDRKNHGIGLQNVKNSIEKYNGEMSYDISENIFKLSICLYNV